MDLADLTVVLLLVAAAAWLWRGHGIRERALTLVRRHCETTDVLLLDDNVALRRLSLLRDAHGQRRLARVYDFEFTVTGEQRHVGSISMFGQHLGRIELAAHPFSTPTAPAATTDLPTAANVVQLSDWRQRRTPPANGGGGGDSE